MESDLKGKANSRRALSCEGIQRSQSGKDIEKSLFEKSPGKPGNGTIKSRKESVQNAAICVKHTHCLTRNKESIFRRMSKKLIILVVSREGNCLWDRGRQNTFCFSHVLNFKLCNYIIN